MMSKMIQVNHDAQKETRHASSTHFQCQVFFTRKGKHIIFQTVHFGWFTLR